MMGWDKVSSFMGSKQVTSPVHNVKGDDKLSCRDAVASEDVPIAVLTKKITAETDGARKAVLEQQLLEELQV